MIVKTYIRCLIWIQLSVLFKEGLITACIERILKKLIRVLCPFSCSYTDQFVFENHRPFAIILEKCRSKWIYKSVCKYVSRFDCFKVQY